MEVELRWTWRITEELLSDRSTYKDSKHDPFIYSDLNWHHQSTLEATPEKLCTIQHLPPLKDRKITTDGETRIDPWFWLRDVDDPETMEYLKSENAFTLI